MHDVAPEEAESDLIGMLFQYSRPIADASQETRGDMRLLPAGVFFETVHVFEFYNRQRLEETLLMLLDDFSRLDQHSYSELYLWCIVQLSRMNPVHVGTFWPLVLDLDLRYRAVSWQRPDSVALVDQPYRLTELVFYFYVINTLQRSAVEEGARETRRPHASLATCLASLNGHLTDAQWELMIDTLRELARTEKRPEFGDACGLLLRQT